MTMQGGGVGGRQIRIQGSFQEGDWSFRTLTHKMSYAPKLQHREVRSMNEKEYDAWVDLKDITEEVNIQGKFCENTGKIRSASWRYLKKQLENSGIRVAKQNIETFGDQVMRTFGFHVVHLVIALNFLDRYHEKVRRSEDTWKRDLLVALKLADDSHPFEDDKMLKGTKQFCEAADECLQGSGQSLGNGNLWDYSIKMCDTLDWKMTVSVLDKDSKEPIFKPFVETLLSEDAKTQSSRIMTRRGQPSSLSPCRSDPNGFYGRDRGEGPRSPVGHRGETRDAPRKQDDDDARSVIPPNALGSHGPLAATGPGLRGFGGPGSTPVKALHPTQNRPIHARATVGGHPGHVPVGGVGMGRQAPPKSTMQPDPERGRSQQQQQQLQPRQPAPQSAPAPTVSSRLQQSAGTGQPSRSSGGPGIQWASSASHAMDGTPRASSLAAGAKANLPSSANSTPPNGPVAPRSGFPNGRHQIQTGRGSNSRGPAPIVRRPPG
jgi:hypothetical protein